MTYANSMLNFQAMDDSNIGFGDELNISGADVKMEPGYSEDPGTSADMTQGQGMVGVNYITRKNLM